MGQEKTTLEIIAPTVEDAISKGLHQLGLEREAVEVEVLDAGNRGLFGLGSRSARVRLTIKVDVEPVKNHAIEESDELPDRALVSEYIEESEKAGPVTSEEQAKVQKIAREVVEELLNRMKVKAHVVTSLISSTEPKEPPTVLVDIQGDDLSILIGRRSETLNALQYITSLIVSKELGRWVPLMIDVQGYRLRRDRQLRQLARKMADQAILTGRRQVLEPMPASERRVIHLELRDHPQVATESMGEEPNRKITIIPKK